MDEKLKKLFESEILNEETMSAIKDALVEIREEIKDELDKVYAEKYVHAKAELSSTMIDLVNEAVASDIEELKEDVANATTIEVRYAKMLEEAKEAHRKTLAKSVEKTINEAVASDLKELKEDILEAKKLEAGRKLFEAFKEEMALFGLDDDAKRIQAELDATKEKLEEMKSSLEEERRGRIMERLLSQLSGTKRGVMSVLLENVETDKLEDRFNKLLPEVISEKKEAVEKDGEKEIVTENKKVSDDAQKSSLEDELFKLAGVK